MIPYILIEILETKETHSLQSNVKKITAFTALKTILEAKYLMKKVGVLFVLRLVTARLVSEIRCLKN
jgi:hypothetical protein